MGTSLFLRMYSVSCWGISANTALASLVGEDWGGEGGEGRGGEGRGEGERKCQEINPNLPLETRLGVSRG